MVKSLPGTRILPKLLIAILSLLNPITHGKGDRMRMQMAFYDNIFQRK